MSSKLTSISLFLLSFLGWRMLTRTSVNILWTHIGPCWQGQASSLCLIIRSYLGQGHRTISAIQIRQEMTTLTLQRPSSFWRGWWAALCLSLYAYWSLYFVWLFVNMRLLQQSSISFFELDTILWPIDCIRILLNWEFILFILFCTCQQSVPSYIQSLCCIYFHLFIAHS